MMNSATSSQGLQLSELSKSYGPIRAVRSISTVIQPAETVALLGPNGAGKTTTIDMLLGLTRPDSGSVSLFGMTPQEAVLAGAVGGMLQTGSLIEYLTVRELVTMVGSIYPNPLKVDEALQLTGATGFANQYTTKLSGGQTQRVRFAIALVADPRLLVLDEPTAAIDVEGRRDFWAVMRDVAARGKTILFATHYLEEADTYADRIIVMARGQIVADGSATEIKARVGNRNIRATLPHASVSALRALTAVNSVEQHGDSILLSSKDSDTTLREFLNLYPSARDIEVHGAGIEEAFLELTADDGDVNTDSDAQ